MVAYLRVAVFAACLLPLIRLVWLGVSGGFGANPVEFLTRSTGTWALVCLCATLTITPLRRLTGWPHWIKLRRMLGLYCFFYAVLHASLWVGPEMGFDAGAMLDDVRKRPFITAGFSAFLMLLPLALTSTTAMMRRLGRNWTTLHRLIYAIAITVILHYWWHKAGKNDFGTVGIYAVLVFVLLALRLIWGLRRRLKVALS